MAARKPKDQPVNVETPVVDEKVVVAEQEEVVEEVAVDVVVVPEPEAPAAEPEAEVKAEGEVVRETSNQLGIFTDFIYNVKNKDALIVINNLGYGDVYYSTEGLAVVGKAERLSFKGSVELKDVDKICFASASQPVVQILEVK